MPAVAHDMYPGKRTMTELDSIHRQPWFFERRKARTTNSDINSANQFRCSFGQRPVA
jgi:hypothetical protein